MTTSTQSSSQPVAIVTGAGKGIGFEIGCELARSGIAVVLNNRTEALTQQAAGYINKTYGPCVGVAGDSSDPGVIQKLVTTAVDTFGQLTIAIANAGTTVYGDFLTYTTAQLNQILQTNLAGSFFLAQAAARQMIAQQRGGSILFMSSVTGHQAHQNLVAYGMTKAGLEMLAKGLVIELSPYRITVNALAPGATLTERTQEDCAYESIWSGITPLGRPASTQDIAYATRFLVSEQARHITGQTLVIDGGWTAISPSPYAGTNP